MHAIYVDLIKGGYVGVLLVLIITLALFAFLRYMVKSVLELQTRYNDAQIKVLDSRLHDLVAAIERVITTISSGEERAAARHLEVLQQFATLRIDEAKERVVAARELTTQARAETAQVRTNQQQARPESKGGEPR